MDIIKCLPFQNVAANSLATVDFKNLIGRVVDRIILQLGGTFTKAQINTAQIKANGKLIYDDSGSRADARQTYRGITANASYLTLDFSEPRSKTIVGQKLGSIDTLASGITSLTGEFAIGAATSPTLVAYAMCSTRDTQLKDTAPLIGKTMTFIHPCTATTTKFPLNIPYGRQAGSLVKRLHVFVASGTITINGIEVRKNGVTIHETLDGPNDFMQTEYGRTPQANCYTVDFIVDGNLSDTLNAANAQTMEYYADVTVTTGGTLAVVAELLDPLGNN
jgi:hypothetical protein